MRKFKIAVCDDELATTDIIKNAVLAAFTKAGETCEIETYTSVAQLKHRLKTGVYDLLFLDICMPDGDGIAFGEYLRKQGDSTEIIYVSNREDKVFDALKNRPFGFVRKKNFVAEIKSVINNFISSAAKSEKSTITVQSKGGIVTVKLADVTYFEGAGKFQLMHVSGKGETVPVYKTMEKLDEELSESGFIRVHKGILVNFRYISRIMVSDVELSTGELVPIARRKSVDIKERYLELLQDYGSILL